MTHYFLKIHLLSEATFGRGDGIAGLLDQEVEHDAFGFPYLRGRTLKGVLSQECDNIVAMLPPPSSIKWNKVLQDLFGTSGSTVDTIANWHFGDACLPTSLRQAVAKQLAEDSPELTPTDILESLTVIRRRTAMNAETGIPDEGSLRSIRVLIRGLTLSSQITTVVHHAEGTTPDDVCLLSAGCLALRHIGVGRNRGRGHVACSLHDEQGRNITRQMFEAFKKKAQSSQPQQEKEEA